MGTVTPAYSSTNGWYVRWSNGYEGGYYYKPGDFQLQKVLAVALAVVLAVWVGCGRRAKAQRSNLHASGTLLTPHTHSHDYISVIILYLFRCSLLV